MALDLQHQLAEMTTVLEQNLRGAKIVKAFALEDAEIARFDAQNQLISPVRRLGIIVPAGLSASAAKN